MSARTLHQPPAVDPCIRNVRQLRGGGFFQTQAKLEREAREWRNCPHGCGMVCKGLLPLPESKASGGDA